MAVTTMPSIAFIIKELEAAYPTLTFESSDDFRWLPATRTIFFDKNSTDIASLLHEVSHSILNHSHFLRDVQLLEMERQAWEHARTILAPKYEITITVDDIENNLDTYREWLHARSTCPACEAIGLQIKTSSYRCIACNSAWRVNDARTCSLRRYVLDIKNTP